MDMMLILTKVLDWLRQRPKVRILVCFVSCVVGLVCYALSSCFNELFEKLIWRKIVPYIVLSLILIHVDVRFTKPSHRSKAILVLVLVATCVYTYFVDEIVEVKPDANILVSYGAFAIMSLFLSTLSHIGFEDELLYFFTCTLIIQLMNIKLWLVIFGWGFMDVLVRLRPTLDPAVALTSGSQRVSGVVGDRNDVAIDVDNLHPQGTRLIGSQEDLPQEVHVPPPQNEDEVGLLVSHASSSQGVTHVPQENEQGNTDNSDIVMARFMDCIKVLEKEYLSIMMNMFTKEVNSRDKLDEGWHKWQRSDNLVVNSLPLEIINNLNESAKLMVRAGLWDICLDEYSRFRRKFLDMFLSLFDLTNLELEDIYTVEKIEGCLPSLKITVNLLFPNERALCQRVFERNDLWNLAFIEVSKELATRLISTCYALVTWSHYRPTEILDKLMEDLYTMFNDLSNESSSLISDEVNQVRMILANFEIWKGVLTNGYEEQEQDTNAADGIHFLTRAAMEYIRDEFIRRDGSLGRCFDKYTTAAKERKVSPSVLVETIINLLENSLEAISKTYETPSLGYVFIMINRTFIEHEVELFGLEPIIGYDWLKRNQDKIEEKLQLYLSSSWDKILNILDEKIDGKDMDFWGDLMEDEHNSFYRHLDGICKDNSMWFVFDDKLRKQIIKSIKNILLPPYEHSIMLFDRFCGNPMASDPVPDLVHYVEDKLDNLFLERVDQSEAGGEEKKNV